MPYLRDNLLFIHVPRCAGSSVAQENNVRARSMQHKSCFHQCILAYCLFDFRRVVFVFLC